MGPTTAGILPLERPALPASADDIVYKIATNREEREEAFRLIYQAYLLAGLAQPNRHAMRITPYHLLPSTTIFVAIHRGIVISSVSLVADDELGMPIQQIYPDVIQPCRNQGLRLGEVTCLADRRRHLSRRLPVLTQLFRLMAQYARRQGLDQLMIAVHPRHAKFYQRVMACEPVGEERQYPLVLNHPAVAMCLDFGRVDSERPTNYDFYFGEPIAEDRLMPSPLTVAEREHFSQIVYESTLADRRIG